MKILKFIPIFNNYINTTPVKTNSPSNSKTGYNTKLRLKLNEFLLELKEFKYLYHKTNIEPIYFFYFIITCLTIIVIGYLENLFTFLIALVYPLYYSIKSLRQKNRERIRNWLKYWIVFSIFMNFEGLFAYFLDEIPLYFFYKVIFLLICFMPQYNGAKYFYEKFIKNIFNQYETHVYNLSVTIANKIKTTLLDSDCEIGSDGENLR